MTRPGTATIIEDVYANQMVHPCAPLLRCSMLNPETLANLTKLLFFFTFFLSCRCDGLLLPPRTHSLDTGHLPVVRFTTMSGSHVSQQVQQVERIPYLSSLSLYLWGTVPRDVEFGLPFGPSLRKFGYHLCRNSSSSNLRSLA